MKVLKIIFVAMFIGFAALQWNDPDPWLWVTIYALAALLILIDLAGNPMKRKYLLFVIAFALYSLTYIPGVIEYISSGQPGEIVGSMKAEKPYIEQVREFGGLLIIIAVLLFLFFKSKGETIEGK